MRSHPLRSILKGTETFDRLHWEAGDRYGAQIPQVVCKEPSCSRKPNAVIGPGAECGGCKFQWNELPSVILCKTIAGKYEQEAVTGRGK